MAGFEAKTLYSYFKKEINDKISIRNFTEGRGYQKQITNTNCVLKCFVFFRTLKVEELKEEFRSRLMTLEKRLERKWLLKMTNERMMDRCSNLLESYYITNSFNITSSKSTVRVDFKILEIMWIVLPSWKTKSSTLENLWKFVATISNSYMN